MSRWHGAVLLIAVPVVLGSSSARAQEVDLAGFDDVVDRNYTIDLYSGAVLGSARIVGMGGAAVAMAEGSASLSANPAAPAVRPATSNDRWDWDWHVDWLSPELGSDFDNNGVPTTEALEVSPFLTAGLVGQYRQWAFGLSFDFAQQVVGLPGDPEIVEVTPTFMVGQVALARSFFHDRLTLGLGLRIGSFEMKASICPVADPECAVPEVRSLFAISGSGLETGAVWRPDDRNLRVGATLSLPVHGNKVTIDDCSNPDDCGGYILPGRVAVPWRVAAGVAWRRGPTRWNRKVATRWRDERVLILSADLMLTGAVDDGYGIEAFVAKKLQPSGRDLALSVRGGAEYEWKPGRLRLRGGSYYEPSRFRTPDGGEVAGRVHVTFGLEYRLFHFCFWGERYRARLGLTGDGAARYFNGGLSVGLWH